MMDDHRQHVHEADNGGSDPYPHVHRTHQQNRPQQHHTHGQPQDPQPAMQAVQPRKKKARRAPRRKKKSIGTPYSELSWEERKRIQEQDAERGRQQRWGAGGGVKGGKSTAGSNAAGDGGPGSKVGDGNVAVSGGGNGADGVPMVVVDGGGFHKPGGRNENPQRKRPREQPPPAPCNTSHKAMAERAFILPSAPHTPHSGASIIDPLTNSNSPVIRSGLNSGSRTPTSTKGSGLSQVSHYHLVESDFNDAFDSAMSSIYEDMEAWDKDALIAGIKERDEQVDRLSGQLQRRGDAVGSGGVTASVADTDPSSSDTLRDDILALQQERDDLKQHIQHQDDTIVACQQEKDTLQVELKRRDKSIQDLRQQLVDARLNLDLRRSVMEIEAEEASAFAD